MDQIITSQHIYIARKFPIRGRGQNFPLVPIFISCRYLVELGPRIKIEQSERSGANELLRPRRRRSFFTNFFAKSVLFILSFPCIVSPFSGGLSVRELRTQKQGGSSPWIFDLAARIRSRILLETGTNFVTHFVVNFVTNIVPKSLRIVSGLFSLSQKIHAKSTPPSGPKSMPILETFFLSGFSGCSTLVCVAALGCQYVYADQRRLVS